MSENTGGRLWRQTAVTLVGAVVVAALSGWLASRDTEAQIAAAFNAQEREVEAGQSAADRSLRREALQSYVRAEQNVFSEVMQAFESAQNVAAGITTLEESPLVVEIGWNPRGFRISIDDLASGPSHDMEVARMRLLFDKPMSDCVERLSLLSRVLLWEASHLAGKGELEWFRTRSIPGSPMDRFMFSVRFALMRRELVDRFIAVARQRVGLADRDAATSCRGLPTHLRGSSTECGPKNDHFYGDDTCLDITIEGLRSRQ